MATYTQTHTQHTNILWASSIFVKSHFFRCLSRQSVVGVFPKYSFPPNWLICQYTSKEHRCNGRYTCTPAHNGYLSPPQHCRHTKVADNKLTHAHTDSIPEYCAA